MQAMENMAAIVGEQARKYAIPLVALNNSEAQSGKRGIAQHMNYGSMGSGHHDCGGGFPIDVLIQMASGSPVPEPTPPQETFSIGAREDDFMGMVKPGESSYAPVPKNVTHIRLFSDVGGQGVNHVKVRLAFHRTGQTNWTVHHVDLTNEVPRRDYEIGAHDGARLDIEEGTVLAGYCYI